MLVVVSGESLRAGAPAGRLLLRRVRRARLAARPRQVLRRARRRRRRRHQVRPTVSHQHVSPAFTRRTLAEHTYTHLTALFPGLPR